MSIRRHVVAFSLLLSAASALPLSAQSGGMMGGTSAGDARNQQQMVQAVLAQNVDKSGIALKGYDPVAYFTMAAPTKGTPQFSATHHGATYHFASGAHRDTFMKEPDKYAPQYGGYCAMGVAGNAKFDIEPAAWRVENGKLYLNKDMKTQAYWMRNVPGNIVKADKNWPTLGAK